MELGGIEIGAVGFISKQKNSFCNILFNELPSTHWFVPHAVWPDKNRQMSIKVAQKWFH